MSALAGVCSMNLQAAQAPAPYHQAGAFYLLEAGHAGAALVELIDGPIKTLQEEVMEILTADDCTDANASDRVTEYMTDARRIEWTDAFDAKYAADKDYALAIPGLVRDDAISRFELLFIGYQTPLWLLIEWFRAHENLSLAKQRAFIVNAYAWNRSISDAQDVLDEQARAAIVITWPVDGVAAMEIEVVDLAADSDDEAAE